MAETNTPEPARLPDDAACEAAIGRLGELDRELARIEADKSERVAKVSKDAEDRAKPHQEERNRLVWTVEAYCAENRKRLTNEGKKKSFKFGTGEIAWRAGRSRVEFDATKSEGLIARLRKVGLNRFVRVKEEIDKSAIGKDAAAIKGFRGIKVVDGPEQFAIKPVGADLAENLSG
ncbi:Mu-like prophage host-nuclease inhibitor protein Gam [Faunimonas pinastri]|uniref:Mu-like prophage host-nuclease inhibitor protein Gam n=1 Tax=Faunimonas pinastri TaxID=1855383 RepID=A0A1H9I7U4_9HYPH|nr:host-nuclease inhibitor Gam family protein [Faunimonas pinastri]SEQ70629.1 Mu-like prophage host-nuclease inhibitor protein Gam [Faunimonas pinastri]